MTPESKSDYARLYSEQGLVLSRANGKMPHGKEWEKSELQEPDAAAGQWNVWGEKYNMGVVLGPSKLIVVEYDTNEARPEWMKLTEGAPTWLQQSGSGKTQAFYRDDEGLNRKVKNSLELRAGIHFHVLAPSIHPDTGDEYKWLPGFAPWEMELAPLPEKAKNYFYGDSEVGQSEPFSEERIKKGGRHAALVSLAGTLRRRGLHEDEILEMLRSFNANRCDPPRADRDLVKIAKDMEKYTPEDPLPEEGEEEIQRWEALSTIASVPITWAVKPVLQDNAFHILAGSKNTGKGAITTYFAAAMTRGEIGGKRRVVWISAGEDSYAIDVRPRIEAAEGIADLVTIPMFPLMLPRDMAEVRRVVLEFGDVGLVVIDPLAGILNGGNSNQESDIYPVLRPLNDLADQMGCIVIGIRHMKKDKSNGALDSIMGSGAWVNIPRSVLGLAFDDSDEDVRHLISITGNRARVGEGIVFRLEGVDVLEDGEPVVRAVKIGESKKDIDALLTAKRPTSQTGAAKDRILDLLEDAHDGIESDTLDAQIMQEFSLAAQTVRNARTDLRNMGLVKPVPVKDDDGKVICWKAVRTAAPR